MSLSKLIENEWSKKYFTFIVKLLKQHNLNWDDLSCYQNISWNIINRFPKLNWNWKYISKNKNITYDNVIII